MYGGHTVFYLYTAELQLWKHELRLIIVQFQGSSDKLNGQLKMHLDSIFDGFQKLISGSEESREKRQLPFVIEKTIHNILFIKTHMQRQDEFDAVSGFLKIL